MSLKAKEYDELRDEKLKDSPFYFSQKMSSDQSDQGRKNLIKEMERQLHDMHARGKAGHWTYNKQHHMAAHEIFQQEKEHYENAKQDGILGDKIEKHQKREKKKKLVKAEMESARAAKAKKKPAKKKKVKEAFILTPSGRSFI